MATLPVTPGGQEPIPTSSEETSKDRHDASDTSTSLEACPVTTETYSIFTARHRRILTAVLALASLASPFTANIYMPLLPLLAKHYQTSAQAINLTLTIYVIVQAIMPAVFAPLADANGRRPISLATYLVYLIASIALAVNDHLGGSYSGLLLLRAVQALGVSACASITYGVIADVCIPADRGAMVGPAVSASNLGVVVGPVLGGLIAWRTGGAAWVFWTLAIFGLTSLGLMLICLPETARTVVGNGGQGKRLQTMTMGKWFLLGPRWGKNESEATVKNLEKHNGTTVEMSAMSTQPSEKTTDKVSTQPTRPWYRRLKLNPFASLIIIFSKDTSLILWLAGCNYAAWYCVSASLPAIYQDVYGWNELAIGLAYLPGAATIILAGFLNGPWAKYKFAMTAREACMPEDAHAVSHEFPIERARARGLWPVWVILHIALAGLGWAIIARVHPAVPLILQAIIGFTQSFLFFAFNTLLVDVHPGRPSTAAAAASLIRSGLSGIGVAVLPPLVGALNYGWYFTLLAVSVGSLQGLCMWILRRWGMGWRQKRRAVEDASRHEET